MNTGDREPGGLARAPQGAPAILQATQAIQAPPDTSSEASALSLQDQERASFERARRFAEPLLSGQVLDTGEPALAHAQGVSAILEGIGAAPSMRAAAYLVYASDFLANPEDVISKSFGSTFASMVTHTRKLVEAQRNARDALADQTDREVLATQLERVRKMLLTFSQDLRVVLLRLASRLQTLRHFAASKRPCPLALAQESLSVFAPLANRLGIWQIKWELEDLAFRFLNPSVYRDIARLLDEKRVERELAVEADRLRLEQDLLASGLAAQVMGRPKHIYSIWKKMQGKSLPFERVLDVRALRVLLDTVPDCYVALTHVHALWAAIPDEFDDYIARPKSNGYQSLHTVVTDDIGRPLEVQIRTHAMHEHAESGVAAHWAYKEAGARGYAGVTAAGHFEDQVAQARRAVLNQLLAWERECADVTQGPPHTDSGDRLFEDRIYVFTPQASLVELCAGATPIDFAYAVHTQLGHRCRGAKVDGVMVPLLTALKSGQTVEIVAAKEGGPSMDWLNPNLGYLQSQRSRAKARAWFNARHLQETISRGREAVDKVLQREGRTAMRLEELASRLGFRSAEALFEVVGKDEYSLRNVEQLLRPQELPPADDLTLLKPARSDTQGDAGILVVGVKSLLTQLSRCCKPAPPDAIVGYVTRGKGVAVHRSDCSSFRQMAAHHGERVIPVGWGRQDGSDTTAVFPVDVQVCAQDRQGLLRDVSDVFAKERMNVIGVNTRSQRGVANMTFTVEVRNGARLQAALSLITQVPGVESARRR